MKKILPAIALVLCAAALLNLFGVFGKNGSDSSASALASTRRSGEEASVSVPRSYGNYMEATVDGTRYTFEAKYARLERNRISISYQAYNVRGEVVCSVLLSLDKNIAPGYYTSENSTALIVTSNMMQAHGGTTNGFHKRLGNFNLNLTYRSADWLTYEGSFSALLVKEASMVSGRKTMEIKDATFRFTIQ